MSPRTTLLVAVAVLALTAALLLGCDKATSSTQVPTSTQETAAAQVTTSASQRAQQPAFKGMELYSWQADTGEWQYSILFGTNRNKTDEEVMVSPLSLDEVKVAISKLAVGEWLTWEGFMPPPLEDIMEELRQCVSLYQVNLQTVFDD